MTNLLASIVAADTVDVETQTLVPTVRTAITNAMLPVVEAQTTTAIAVDLKQKCYLIVLMPTGDRLIDMGRGTGRGVLVLVQVQVEVEVDSKKWSRS